MRSLAQGCVVAALWLTAASAAADCYTYNYAETTLRGEIVLKVPARPMSAAAVHRKPGEKHTFLKLDQPICMAASTNSYESAEAGQAEITLYTLQDSGLGAYAGKRVAVTGVLMHSFASDAHTPLQLVVRDVAEIAK